MAGASGAWVSGPKDLAPPEYFWGYEQMTTTKGLFAAGDASGASSHKFSSGSHAEGRIAGKAAVRYLVKENPAMPTVDDATVEKLKAETGAKITILSSSSSVYEICKARTDQREAAGRGAGCHCREAQLTRDRLYYTKRVTHSVLPLYCAKIDTAAGGLRNPATCRRRVGQQR